MTRIHVNRPHSRPLGGSVFSCAATAAVFAVAVLAGRGAWAAEGGLGRPISGTSVVPDGGIVPPEPVLAVNFAQIFYDGRIGGGRQVPLRGQISLGIEGQVSFTLATILKVWNEPVGGWSFASSVTLPYMYTKVKANLTAGARQGSAEDTASNLFDLNFSPIIAGYHFSKTEHLSLSLNIWAPTGRYDKDALANPSLNNWTVTPQIAYTRIFPEQGMTLDVVAGVQFYTRNKATDYKNAPLFTLDVMGMKKWPSGWGAGLIVGTVQQLGDDKGATADRLNGFRGRDWALGPIVTYDTKFAGGRPLSFSLRWVPTISHKNRMDSRKTVMATATMVF